MPEGEPAEAIKQLTYVPGGATGCAHNLLVLGGGIAEMPPALTILPLECLSDQVSKLVSLGNNLYAACLLVLALMMWLMMWRATAARYGMCRTCCT